MPPEPLPWDRKEYFRDRRYEFTGGGGGGGGGSRWRDYGGSRNNDFSPRWAYPSPDFRRPPGHGKHGGWHMYSEDHPYQTPRSGDRFMDDDIFRSPGVRGDGRYGRFYRDNRPSFGQREWRGHSWEGNHHHSSSANGVGRPHIANELRSVGDSPMHASHRHSESCDQFHLKDQVDKTNDANGSGANQKVDQENVVGSDEWNHLKWSRSRSLTSRGSGFSHASSSKSIGGDSSDAKGNLVPKNVTPVQSPSGDPAACVPSVAPPEEASSRKKARLGWGEGLAKYEKKKVDGPEDNVNKAGNATPASNVEPSNSLASNLADQSPKVMGFSDCSSPATPSSFACSSSPGLDDKTCGKTIDVDGDASNFSVASMPALECQPEQSHFSLERLELNSITNLGSMLTELLQADDQCSLDTGFMRTSALNKLLLWKGDISKALELTETEIDSLENELSSLKSATVQSCDDPASSNSGFDGPNNGSNVFPRPPHLEVVSNGDVILEGGLLCNDTRGILMDSKDEDIDSPGTATSKFVDPPIQKSLSIEVCKNSSSGESSCGDFTTSSKENLSIVINEIDMGTGQIGDVRQHANHIETGIENTTVCNKKDDNICEIILAANKESANGASEVLYKLLPSCDYIHANRGCCSSADSTVLDKFLKRKRLQKFKERVLSVKFQAFHHLWKEDLRFLSSRNHRTKLEKLNLGSRSLQIRSHKHRSSIRSRFASSAGTLSLVSMTEISSFTGKLLSDSQVKLYRSSLKMPAMILDDKEKMSRFVSSNGLVEDPCAVEKERSLINPWTSEEKDVFITKLAIHGKDFRKIASFLDHKTTADCVEFYYKNHKSECFEKFKKLEVKKQDKPLSSSTYLVTSGKKWSREMNAAPLDILGAASVIAAEADQALETSQMLLGKSSNKKNRGSDNIIEASSSFYCAEEERETAAADVLAGICGSLSSEAMSSCITSSVDPGEGNPDLQHQKVGSSIRRPLTPEVTQNLDDDSCSDESCGEMDPTDWTDDEKSLFVRAFSSHGKDFLLISRCVGSKSRDQCKVFFSKARKCLGLDTLDQHRSAGINMSYDTNGRGEGDAEDVGVVETGSVVCSDKLKSRLDDVLNVNKDVSKPEALPELSILEQNCWPRQLDRTDADMADASDLVDCDGVVDDLQKDSASAVNASRSEEDVKSKMDLAIDVSVAQDAPHFSGLTVGREAGSGSSCSKSEMEPFSASVDFASYGGEFLKPSLTRDNAFNHLSGESPCSSKGFPLDLSIKADLHDVVTHSVGAETIIDHTFQGSFLRKCNRPITPQNLVSDPSFLQRSRGDAGSQSLKIEKPSGANGDVKLFGKILSKPSSVDITNSEEKAKHHSSSGGKFDMKLAAKQDSKGNPTCFANDQNGFLGLENVPIRSYGFWDGTKIQTGFTSLPDSALLLAKYPATFANYAISSPKSQQPPLQATSVNSNECNMNNGACVFSPREYSSSNGGGSCIDYTVLRNQEGGIQPFRLDMKQRPLDATCSELTHRNGCECVASLSPQGNGLVKLNVIQGGDVIGVSSSCTTISDPVAALKLHYPSQHFSNGGGGHAVNGIIREDSWHSQGDLRR